MIDHLKIWERINETKTVDELKSAIKFTFGESGSIMGRTEPFTITEMLVYIDWFAEDFQSVVTGVNRSFRALPTRKYGIRQQLCMILLNPSK